MLCQLIADTKAQLSDFKGPRDLDKYKSSE